MRTIIAWSRLRPPPAISTPLLRSPEERIDGNFIGILLAIAGIGLAAATGLARERSFYSTIMIWIASNYVLFALIGGSRQTLILESLLAAGFMAVALIGFRANLWVVVAALVGHGLFDFVHHQLVASPGVPPWWPGFCLAFDVTAGGLLAFLLSTHNRFSVAPSRGQ